MQTQGERLEEIITVLKLSREELAEKINSSVPSISKVVRNKGNFGIDVYINLITNLNVSVNWLLSGKGTMFIQEKASEHDAKFDEFIKEKVLSVLIEYDIIDAVK